MPGAAVGLPPAALWHSTSVGRFQASSGSMMVLKPELSNMLYPNGAPTPPHIAAADSGGRRQTRSRKVSQRMAVVDESTRQQAVQARLDALENDNNEPQDPFGLVDDDDDEFMLASDGEDGACGALLGVRWSLGWGERRRGDINSQHAVSNQPIIVGMTEAGMQ